MKLIKQFSIILIILLMIAGISTVLAVSDDDSLGTNKGSFVSEDSYSDGDGHFESDDDSSSPPSDDDVDDDVDDEDNPEDNSFKVNLLTHATGNPILLLLLVIGAVSVCFKNKF